MSKPEKIRNVKAFLRSYMASSSGQRALTRLPSFREIATETHKGRVDFGYNTIAHAMQEAVCKT